jgi:hypothetical protein
MYETEPIVMSAIVWSDGQDRPVQEIFSGIRARQLWQGEHGGQAVMVEIEPGAICDGTRDYSAGTFIHHPIGSSHIPQSTIGCTLFIFYPEKYPDR